MIQVRLRHGVWVAIQRDRERADRPHLEWSRPDRAHGAVRARGYLLRRHGSEEVLGDDADPQRERKRGIGCAQGEHDLAGTTRRDADLPPDLRAGLLVLEVLQHMEGEQHVVGNERLAVAPLDTVAQVDGVRKVIRRHRPVAGEDADDVLLRVDGGQALVDQAVDVPRALVALEERVQDVGLADQRLDCRPAASGLGHGGDGLARANHQDHRQRGDDESTP